MLKLTLFEHELRVANKPVPAFSADDSTALTYINLSAWVQISHQYVTNLPEAESPNIQEALSRYMQGHFSVQFKPYEELRLNQYVVVNRTTREESTAFRSLYYAPSNYWHIFLQGILYDTHRYRNADVWCTKVGDTVINYSILFEVAPKGGMLWLAVDPRADAEAIIEASRLLWDYLVNQGWTMYMILPKGKNGEPTLWLDEKQPVSDNPFTVLYDFGDYIKCTY